MFARLQLVPALALALAACAPAPPAERPTLALMSSLPLYWGEEGQAFGAMLDGDAEPDWVRTALEQRFVLAPLDALEPEALRSYRYLLLAQPRPLSPQENVALDAWVRGGGRLLLLADPLLTRHSDYAVGDPRRPQDTALLSPILARWGLELQFDGAQGDRSASLDGTPLPLRQAGRLQQRNGSRCEPIADAVLMRCPIERGQALVLADAAVLDDPAAGAALQTLLVKAFD